MTRGSGLSKHGSWAEVGYSTAQLNIGLLCSSIHYYLMLNRMGYVALCKKYLIQSNSFKKAPVI